MSPHTEPHVDVDFVARCTPELDKFVSSDQSGVNKGFLTPPRLSRMMTVRAKTSPRSRLFTSDTIAGHHRIPKEGEWPDGTGSGTDSTKWTNEPRNGDIVHRHRSSEAASGFSVSRASSPMKFCHMAFRMYACAPEHACCSRSRQPHDRREAFRLWLVELLQHGTCDTVVRGRYQNQVSLHSGHLRRLHQCSFVHATVHGVPSDP